MTHFHDRNQPRGDAWVTTGDDELDEFLNTNEASTRAPDAGNDDLASTASAFHRRFDEAQERDPSSSRPDPNLWNRVLADAGSQGKAISMSSAPHTLNSDSTIAGPRALAQPIPPQRHSRLGRWANAFAAVSLVLLIAVGVWFSGYGPGGAGGPDVDPRYAAQVVSPMSSPAASATACTIEPLTVDEVMDRISDLSGWVAAHTGERMTFTPGALTDPTQMIRTSDVGLDVPQTSEFEAMQQATNQYLDCLREGTVGQFWATFSPHMLQREIFGTFPIYRSEETVRSYVEESIDLAAASFSFPPYAWDDIELEAVPDPEDSRIDSISDPFLLGYVPTQGVDAEGTIIARSDWADHIEELVETSGPPPSWGTITLVKYPGSDQWFINDSWVMVPDEPAVPSPVASPGVASTDVVIATEDIAYDPASVTISANTDVRITLVNNDFMPHDFVIDELGIQTDLVQSGETVEVTINADPGEYTFYCSVPGHRDAGMEGTLIVK